MIPSIAWPRLRPFSKLLYIAALGVALHCACVVVAASNDTVNDGAVSNSTSSTAPVSLAPTTALDASPSPSVNSTDAIAEKAETSVAYEIFRYSTIVVLVILSSLFSGLTLGLLSLDKVGLEVIIGAGEQDGASEEEMKKAKAAKRVLPVRESGNQLLTTLVLGNVAVNSLLSILMADITTGLVGFFTSTALIVIFGEILPQSLCSRHALAIGARCVPLVRVLRLIMYPIAKPIGLILDRVLGEDIGTIFSKVELLKFLEIHVRRHALHPNEGHILRGAMRFKYKQVAQIMVPAPQVYTLPASTVLNMATIKQIYQRGYSRIPVWGKDRNDIIGVLFTKDLALVDPKEDVSLEHFVQVFGRGAHRVWPDTSLGDLLKTFKKGTIHMALVYDVNNTGPYDPFYELKGMVTLEDVVEDILQDKIVDDTDSPELQEQRKLCADRITMDYV